MFNAKVYLSGKGRIGRQTWWISVTLLSIVYSIFAFIFTEIDFATPRGSALSIINMIAMIILVLTYFGASMTVSIKRLHDTEHSGWWLLLLLVPYAGWLGLFYFLGIKKGTDEENKYGDNPLELE
jgi:uncharacterized membrane protein YhaH (DUF805 family)